MKKLLPVLLAALCVGCQKSPAPTATAAVVAASPPPAAETPPPMAQVVTEASAVRFAALKNGEATVEGALVGITGEVAVDLAQLDGIRGVLQVDLARIDTGLPPRDENIANAFFHAAEAKGTVRIDGVSVGSGGIEPGQSLQGKVELSIDLGLGSASAIGQVEITRPSDDRLVVTFKEPLPISIAALGMEGRKAELIALCQHESIGDEVTLSGAVTLALPR